MKHLKNPDKLTQAAGWLILLLLYIRNILCEWHYGIYLLDSDASAEMILAQLMNEEHRIFTGSWYYSTELRFFDAPLAYRLGLSLFPHNWRLARTCAIAVLLALLILSVWYLMRTLGQEGLFPWYACLVLCPVGEIYGQYILYLTHYTFHLIRTFLAIALLLRFCTNEHTGLRRACLALCAALGICSGLTGVRIMMVCYVPLLCALCFLYIIHRAQPLFRRALFGGAVSCMGGMTGFLLNRLVITPLIAWEDEPAGMKWESFSLERVLDSISDLVNLYGWRDGVSYLSPEGITNLLCMLLICVILLSGFRLFKQRSGLSDRERIILAFLAAAFLIELFVLSQSNYRDEPYWTTFMPFVYLPPLLLLTRLNPGKRICCCTALTGLLLMFGIADQRDLSNISDSYAFTMQPVVNWLVSQGYHQGIAMFWNSDILTELSDGKLEMWTVADGYGTEMLDWLQKKSHTTEMPQGRFFVFGTSGDAATRMADDTWDDHLVYGDKSWYVWDFSEFDSYSAMYPEPEE